jgi:hypothetical protein
VRVIDPTGVWWGLRLLADGHTPGYPVVISGGPHADLDIDEASGTRLAEIIAAGSFSCIVDTSAMTVGERTRLFTDFAEALPRANAKPLHLVIDEAHQFAPQGRVPDPQSGRMLHAANNLVSGGRARGLRVVLISQRPAKLHKPGFPWNGIGLTLGWVELFDEAKGPIIPPRDKERLSEESGGEDDRKVGATMEPHGDLVFGDNCSDPQSSAAGIAIIGGSGPKSLQRS